MGGGRPKLLETIQYDDKNGILYIDITDKNDIYQIQRAFDSLIASYYHSPRNYNYAFICKDELEREYNNIEYSMINGVIIENLPDGYSYGTVHTQCGLNTIMYFRNDEGIDDDTEGFFIILHSALDKIRNIAFKIDDIERFDKKTLYTGDIDLLLFTFALYTGLKPKNLLLYDEPGRVVAFADECNIFVLYSINQNINWEFYEPIISLGNYTIYTADGKYNVSNGTIKKDNSSCVYGFAQNYNVDEYGNIITDESICITSDGIVHAN